MLELLGWAKTAAESPEDLVAWRVRCSKVVSSSLHGILWTIPEIMYFFCSFYFFWVLITIMSLATDMMASTSIIF